MILMNWILIYFFITMLSIQYFAQGIRWLGLAKLQRHDHRELEPFSNSECYNAKSSLRKKRHYKFCLHDKHSYAMHGIMMASKAAAYYCMKTFKNRRWNCTSVQYLPNILPDLKLGTQEQAIVHAFSSAALVFEIARRCSESKLRHCSCGRELNQPTQRIVSNSMKSQYFYNNCPDNIDMGVNYARKFLGYHRMGRKRKRSKFRRRKNTLSLTTIEPRPKPSKALRKKILKRLNGHNYEVGLEIMKKSWKSRCKCHGVSGSCSHEMCFRQMRRLDDDVLLQQLKDHYLKAKYVEMEEDGQLYPPYYNVPLDQRKPLSADYLGFTEHSPDYCESDPTVGSAGTFGRQCETTNVTKSDTIHCSNMCCGRGHREVITTETIRCKCRLDQNFIVKCKFCSQMKIKKYCL